MLKTNISAAVFTIALVLSTPALAIFKVPNTDFGESVDASTAYETKSLLMKFNYKTHDLNIGPYTGEWKNRKSSGGFLIFDKRKTSADITLVHDTYGTYGTWTIWHLDHVLLRFTQRFVIWRHLF